MAGFDSSAQTIVLDLSRLEFMDSTGVRLADKAVRIAAERHREFFLVRGPQHIQRPFDLAGVTDRLPFVD
jgi:anti-anti-sigma factor